MSAFVPAAGLSPTSRRTFLTGGTTLATSTNAPNDTLTMQLPKLPTPKLPDLPNIPLPNIPLPKLGKQEEQPAPPPPPKTLSIGGEQIDPTVRPDPKKSYLGDGLPKFYNPSTSRAEFVAAAKGQNATAFDSRVGAEGIGTNRRVNVQGTFRNMDPYTDELVWARPGWSSDEARVGVNVVLKNVLGNAYLFDSELEEIGYSISCVKQTANIKEFVRAVALSSLYRERFFENASNTRFVECNFLHFLGRAPKSQQEVSEHIRIINEQGYNAEINSYIDSDEYDTLWGESRIPAPNFKGGHPYNNDMNKLAVLRSNYVNSDRVTTKPMLLTGDATGFAPFGILKGLPEAWRGENEARNIAGPVMEFSPDVFWNPQPAGLREAELDWLARMGNWTKFWYKDSQVYKEVMKPNMSQTVEEVEEAEAVLKYGSTMAKSYLGCRWAYSVAPVIEMRPPSTGAANGQLSVKMTEITFAIPADLTQKV